TSELAFGCENLALSNEEINHRITKTTDELEFSQLIDRNIFQISGGEKQQIAMGSIYAATPEIYILDEPSSNMDARSIERLRNILEQLKAQGKTIIISEHRLYFLLDLADRFLYFKEGKLEREFLPAELVNLEKEELHKLGLRHTKLEDVKGMEFTFQNHQKGVHIRNLNCFREEKHVLSIKDLSFHEHSVVAIIGENGAGKSTFIDCVSGFLPSRSEIYLGDRNMNEKDRMNKSFVVMQDVNRQLFCSSVKEEIALKSKKSEEELLRFMELLDIEQLADRHPASLSGGQKQRVAICSAFASDTEIMFYDEPTSGLDFKGMDGFCKLVRENQMNHKITFVITHDLELILGSCTHVLHLEKGQVMETYSLDEHGKGKLADFFIKRKSKMDRINELKRKKQPLLKSLLAYSGKMKPLMYVGLVLSAISALLFLVPMIAIWYGTKEIFEMYPHIELSKELLTCAYGAVGAAILGIFIYGCGLMCTHAVAFRVARNMKSRAIHKLMDLPLGYFNTTGSGKIRRTLNETIAKTEAYLAHQMPDMIGAFVTPIAVLFFIFTYNWQLGLISIIPLGLSCIAMALMMNTGTAERLREYQTSLERMNNEAVEYVRGISVVKTFGQSVFSFKKFHKTIEEYKGFVVGYSIMCRTPMVLFQTLLASVSLFLVFGGIIIFSYTSDVRAFMLDFLFYLFFTPIYGFMMMKLMWVSQNTQLASDAVDRTEELLNERTLTYKTHTKTPTNFDIIFEQVTFAYPNTQKNAVEHVSLEIKQGQTVALVGGSGGGKSTLATLIPRFWDVQEGAIKIG
ncbi:MAG: ATP-binding cassette domain-containing protein, partial [Eubacteriales bacterium]